MGWFGSYLYDGTSWTEIDGMPTTEPEFGMFVYIHDSDYALVRYTPPFRGTGEAFLGFTANAYFETDDDPATDTAREASGLHDWCVAHLGAAPDEATIADCLAADDDPLEEEDAREYEEWEFFAEQRTARFLLMLGVPLPEALEPRT